MEQIRTKIRKWGNSFGVIIPSHVVASQNLKEGSELELTIHPKDKMSVADVLELARKFRLKKKRDTQKILDEMDRELWPEGE